MNNRTINELLDNAETRKEVRFILRTYYMGQNESQNKINYPAKKELDRT